jgi:hypothetical protein
VDLVLASVKLDFTDFWVINTWLELVTIVETCGNQRTNVSGKNLWYLSPFVRLVKKTGCQQFSSHDRFVVG